MYLDDGTIAILLVGDESERALRGHAVAHLFGLGPAFLLGLLVEPLGRLDKVSLVN